MTPFGLKIRELRAERQISQKKMAADLNVSAAYLSALEHGHRGQPPWSLVQKIISYFNIIWDEAEDLENLARLSHPRVVIDTSGLDAETTELVNHLSQKVRRLSKPTVLHILSLLKEEKS
ncbi:MAG: transcriptional regulator [Kordiimonas sp.]|nr:transcriptional regulator [Kordiimonas sp.]|tara:strand:- start:4405 stop:4764 length:360 start_codon:yes stop_codon:yes gene_type:complete